MQEKQKSGSFVFDVKNAATIEFFGGVPEWLKGADCKSVGLRLHWFESSPLHQFLVEEFEGCFYRRPRTEKCGSSSMVEP